MPTNGCPWETVYANDEWSFVTRRMRVPGGWMIWGESVMADDGSVLSIASSMAFCPDPTHEWTIAPFSEEEPSGSWEPLEEVGSEGRAIGSQREEILEIMDFQDLAYYLSRLSIPGIERMSEEEILLACAERGIPLPANFSALMAEERRNNDALSDH